MNTNSLKAKIINECIKIQKQKVAINEKAINDIQQVAKEYEKPTDIYDSFITQEQTKKELLINQLEKLVNELQILKRIDKDIKYSKIDFGAVVITNKSKLFISTGIGKITIDNDVYYAISQKSPLFESMKNLKKGNNFIFNDNSFEIIDVF